MRLIKGNLEMSLRPPWTDDVTLREIGSRARRAPLDDPETLDDILDLRQAVLREKFRRAVVREMAEA